MSCFSSKSVGDTGYLSDGRYQRDPDQLSVSSIASSASSVSPRFTGSDYGGTYVPMGPSPNSTNRKVSVSFMFFRKLSSIDWFFRIQPRPPKKPPRRNLSVSPTHLTPNSPGAYEYLFLSRSGDDTMSVSSAGSGKLRRGRSADQYEVMRLRQSYVTPIDLDSPVPQRRKSEQEPVALTYVCDEIQVR